MLRIICILCISLLLFVACNKGNGKNSDVGMLESVGDFGCCECTDCGEAETCKVIHKCASEDGCLVIELVSCSCENSSKYFTKWTICDDAGKKHVMKRPKSSFQSWIHSIVKNDGSVYYIVLCCDSCSSKPDAVGYLEAYKIVGDSVLRVNVKDGGTRIDNKEFEVKYCSSNWYWITHGAGYARILDYDLATKNLYVPITVDCNIIDRYRVWHFNGERFAYVGELPHKNLHKSLSKYECLVSYLTTEDYIVRVDSLYNRELRFALWKKPKTMSDKPDVLIKGGKWLKHTDAYEKECQHDDFYFSHGGYEYFIVYCKESHIKGWGCIPHYDLIVKIDGEAIIHQEYVD